MPFKVEDVYFKRSLTNSLRKKSLLVGLDQNKITTSSIVIISVNFDVELKKVKINFKNLKKIVQDVALRIRPGCLIIVESTLPPGTTSKIIYPEIVEIFKKRKIELDKIRLAYSFERVTPGSNYLNSIKLMHRVYAGINKQSELEVKRFLKSIIDTRQAKLCKLSSITEAETCKIIENTYRAMNIAFIEEWRNFSSLNGLNLNEILNFIRFRKTHNNIMRPGIGVGGYCLTKDPLMGEIASKKILKKG